MKKKITLLLVLFVCLQMVQARKLPGYFVSNTGDTVKVTFKIPLILLTREPNIKKLQRRVRIYSVTGEKVDLDGARVKEIFFQKDGQRFRMRSCKNNLGLAKSSHPYVYLLLEDEGKLNLYHYRPNFGSGIRSINADEFYILQKGNGDLFRPALIFFRKSMSKYFEDCPEFSKKFDTREYDGGDTKKIVYDYNRSNCK